MVITLKLESAVGCFDEKTDIWYRTIEIESGSNLEGLHLCIQDAINFDNDHLYEFFIANTYRSRDKLRFDDENEGLWEFAVGDLFPLPKNKKLFYMFDYGDSWYFKISKTRKKPTPKQNGITYPRVVDAVGQNPEQYPDYDDEW